MNMTLDEAIKILTSEYPSHLKEEAIKLIYKLVEESAYYRDLVKLERKEKEHLKKQLKGEIAVKDTEINKLNNVIDRMAKFIHPESVGTENVCDKYGDCIEDDLRCNECIKQYFMKPEEN